MKESHSQQHRDSPKASDSASGSARRQADAAQKPFAVFDIDGTLIRWQLYHALADALAKRGYIQAEAFQIIRAARMDWKRRIGPESFTDYEMQLMRLYVKVLRKLTVNQLDEAAESVFQEYKDQVYTYTRNLIAELKGKGYLLFAISGSQVEIVEKIADYYGFDDFVSRVDERKNNKFTGKATTPIFDKDFTLKEFIKKHGAKLKNSIAVGDSASDIKMLEIVEKPIAFNPETRLFEHARNKGWDIVIERKNVVYQLKPGQDGQYKLV